MSPHYQVHIYWVMWDLLLASGIDTQIQETPPQGLSQPDIQLIYATCQYHETTWKKPPPGFEPTDFTHQHTGSQASCHYKYYTLSQNPSL